LAISKAQKGREISNIIIADGGGSHHSVPSCPRGAGGCMASPHSHTKRSEGFNYL